MSQPAFTMKVAGATFDHRAARVQFKDVSLFRRDGFGTFNWFVPGVVLADADPFEGKAIELWIDAGFGAGSVRRFAGTCEASEFTFDRAHGWGKSYTAYDKRWAGDLVPHTDAITTIDTSPFNLAPDDPDNVFLAGRLGRTNGQILQAVLDMPDNNRALTALGIGGYTSTGYGAAATATLTGDSVSGATVTSGGSGYNVGDTVYFNGTGAGAYGHVATVDVNGAVTGIAVDAGGAGFTAPPAVIISALPLATVRDLALMNTLIPFPVTVQGEKLLEAIDGQMRNIAPNHMMWVRPDGVLRFLDQRSFGGPIAIFSGGGGSGATASLIVNASGVIAGYTLNSGGTGYTSAPQVTVIDPSGSGAAITATVSGGAVTALTIGSGGSGYSRGLTLTLDSVDSRGRVVDPEALSLRPSTENCFSRVLGRGQPRTDGVWVGLAPPPGSTSGNNGLQEYFDHDGLTTALAKSDWNWLQFSVPDGSQGQAILNVTFTSGVLTSVSVQYGGYGYANSPAPPPTVHVVPVSGGSGASISVTVTSGTITAASVAAGGSGYTGGASVFVDMPGGPTGDSGTCTCPNTSQIVVTSGNPAMKWAANEWDQSASGRKGYVYLVYTTGTGLTARIDARVIANTAMSPGGTSTLTLDVVLPHTNFNAYKLCGLVGGASIVWRRYKVVDPALAQHMAPRFSIPKAVPNSDGSALTLVSMPFCRGLYSTTGKSPYYEIPIPASFDPTSGTILTDLPTVRYFGTLSNLIKGGNSTDGTLSDFQAFLAVYKGALTTPYPPDSGGLPTYGGTSYAQRNLQRTLTVTIPDWRDAGQTGQVNQFVQDLFDTVKDVQWDGTIEVIGLYEEAFAPGNGLSIAGPGYATGWESLRLPIVECTLRWSADGAKYRTALKVSNRRAHFTAETFVRPAPSGFTWTAPGGGDVPFVAGSLGATPDDDPGGLLGMMGAMFGQFGGNASAALGDFFG